MQLNKISKLQTLTGCMAIAFVCFAGSATAQAQTDTATSADAVMDKYIEVSGGLEKYKSLKTMSSEGTISIPAAGIEGTISITQDCENGRLYTKAVLPGAGEEESGCDGETCWQISPMMGGPSVLEGSQADQIREQATMESVYDYKNFYKSIEVKGEEEVGDEKCYKLEFTKQNDSKETKFFSIESGLAVKSIVKIESPMGAMEVEVSMSDYKEVDGMMVPGKMEQALPNGMTIVIEMEETKFNPELDDSMFELPEAVQELVDAEESDK